MACNTLLNATEHFKEKDLLGANRSVAPEDYNAVEQEIKDLEQEKKDLELSLESGILGQDDLVQKSQRIGEVLALLNEKEMIWLELSEKM